LEALPALGVARGTAPGLSKPFLRETVSLRLAWDASVYGGA